MRLKISKDKGNFQTLDKTLDENKELSKKLKEQLLFNKNVKKLLIVSIVTNIIIPTLTFIYKEEIILIAMKVAEYVKNF